MLLRIISEFFNIIGKTFKNFLKIITLKISSAISLETTIEIILTMDSAITLEISSENCLQNALECLFSFIWEIFSLRLVRLQLWNVLFLNSFGNYLGNIPRNSSDSLYNNYFGINCFFANNFGNFTNRAFFKFSCKNFFRNFLKISLETPLRISFANLSETQ